MNYILSEHFSPQQHDGDQSLNGTLNLSYQERKFNTPYERHLETCRNRYQNEEEPEEEEKPVVKQEPQMPDLSVESKPEPKVVSKLPLKALKRKEDREAKQKLVQTETADKLRFNNYEPAQKKAKTDRESKYEFPMHIKLPGEIHDDDAQNDNADDDDDDDDYYDRRNMMGQSSQNNSFSNGGKKGKNKKKKFRKPEKVASKDFRQTSNKPVPFDYSQADYSKFKGGSKPLPQKGKKGKFFARKAGQGTDAGEGSIDAAQKRLHPNSRIAKGIKQSQKLFNFSSNSSQKKK